ncbi:hypothetical protein B0T22DRAFT_480952 [Podospora appendiculata]|uniref:Uncharacterized protein n=1 Tax=Podospora appendiculata TaxID=314037 RepID=A0AAE0XBW9_9PEZI|nr:hypothetical protein B0T22DRAFT_480952 [Podospora appendiculata]
MDIDAVKRYRLREDALESYLRQLFPGQDIQVNVQGISYSLTIPRKLTAPERRYIDKKIRSQPDD